VTAISLPSIVDLVVRELRGLIVSGEVRPGDRLVEERLTERFGVSRPPVREALRILEREGLVQRLPRRGAIVTPLDANDVREIYSLRWALERLAIELALPVEDEERLEALREAVAAMRDTSDRETLLEANWRFHLALVSLPGHKRLLAAYEALLAQLRLCMAMNLRFREQVTGDPADSVRRHERLLELIAAGDLAPVLREIERHGDRSFMERLDEFVVPSGC
jgi:DNA-binding GntR family transcriptional regulator